MHLKAGSDTYVPLSFFLHCDKEVLWSRTGRANQQYNQLPCLVSQTYNTVRNSINENKVVQEKSEILNLQAL